MASTMGGFAPEPTPSPPHPVASDSDVDDDDYDDDDDDDDASDDNGGASSIDEMSTWHSTLSLMTKRGGSFGYESSHS